MSSISGYISDSPEELLGGHFPCHPLPSHPSSLPIKGLAFKLSWLALCGSSVVTVVFPAGVLTLSSKMPFSGSLTESQKTPKAKDGRKPLEIFPGGMKNVRTSLGKGLDHVTEFLSVCLCRDFDTPAAPKKASFPAAPAGPHPVVTNRKESFTAREASSVC